MLLGLIGAAAAAVAYGAATVLQALGVRHMSGVRGDAGWWARVKAGRLYGAGLTLDVLGFLASVVSLRRLPLFMVQAAIASSIAVTAMLAVLVLGDHLSRAEAKALGVTGAGLVLLAVSARSGSARHLGTPAGWLLLAAAILLTLAAVAGVRDQNANRAWLVLACASGLGFGIVGIGARGLQIRDPWWHTAADPVLWAVALSAALAVVAYGFALHRGQTTTVAAVTLAVETVAPAIVGLTVLGDAVRSHLVPVAAVGFVAAVGGSIALANHAEPGTRDEAIESPSD